MGASQESKGSAEAACYIRVTSRARTGFVEFNFSINDPTLFLEMILPVKAFEDFCKHNNAQFLTPEQESMVDRHEMVWYDSVAGESSETTNNREQH